jgi:Protein of unknown function (DUF3375)
VPGTVRCARVTSMFDAETLDGLRDRHATWRLLRYEHAPIVIAFVHRAFVASHIRSVSQFDLASALEDTCTRCVPFGRSRSCPARRSNT